jgi:CheY-like chemotaxis protein
MPTAESPPEFVNATLGPVPMRAAAAWLMQARAGLAAMRTLRPHDLPEDVVDAFAELLAAWSAELGTGEAFVWSGQFQPGRLGRIAGHWAAVARAARTEGLAVGVPSDEARPFYDELVAFVGRAVTMIPDRDGVGPALLAVVPAFEDSIAEPDRAEIATRRVLIVDDTADIRFLVRIGLRNQPGLEVCGEAVDGIDALEQAALLQPDAILLDLSMPRMTGLEALPELRRLLPSARIVIFSASPQAKADALAAGAAAFVEKGEPPENVAAALLGEG